MNIVCLDFEGVLIPDIWPEVAKAFGEERLMLTTRDVSDYRELMDKRVEICKDRNISLSDIQEVARGLSPLEGAIDFVNWINKNYQLILLSDTFYEFVPTFMQQLGYPTLFCHSMKYNQESEQLEYILRQDNQKQKAVEGLRALNFKIFASGDSFNDVSMMEKAHGACFFNAPENVKQSFPQYKIVKTFDELKTEIKNLFDSDQ